jgi:hypothetical protein
MCKIQVPSTLATLKLSFLIAALNCCLYTLPINLLNILQNSLTDRHLTHNNGGASASTNQQRDTVSIRDYLHSYMTFSEIIHPSSIQQNTPSVRLWFIILISYVILNLSLVIYAVKLQTWIPVPYVFTIIPFLVCGLNMHVSALIALSSSTVLIIGSIMLASVHDQTVYSVSS